MPHVAAKEADSYNNAFQVSHFKPFVLNPQGWVSLGPATGWLILFGCWFYFSIYRDSHELTL